MISIKKTATITIATSIALASIGAAFASSDYKYKSATDQDLIPVAQVMKKAKQEHPGRIIEAELERKRSGYVYEIKSMNETGAVMELKYDAKTGKLLQTEREYD